MAKVAVWLCAPGHVVVVYFAVWLVAGRLAARHWMTRRDRLDIDLRLVWRTWHWFSGAPFVAWKPTPRSRLDRWVPWLRLPMLEGDRAGGCVDSPRIADLELIEPDSQGDLAPDDIEPVEAGITRPWWGCRQRRVAIAAARTAGTLGVVAAECSRVGLDLAGPRALIVPVLATAAIFGLPIAWAFRMARRAIYWHWERPAAAAVYLRAKWREFDSMVKPRSIARCYRVDQYGLDLRITVAPVFEPTETNLRELVNDVVHIAGIDLGRVSPDFEGLKGRWPRTVLFKPAKLLPDLVLFNVGQRLVKSTVEVIERMSKPDAPVLGWGRGSKIVNPSVDSDSPHLLFSGRSGSGKSVFLKMVAAQFLWHGADLYVLDYKRVSHRWVTGPHGLLQGVRCYARDIESIHHRVLELADIAMARFAECDPLTAADTLPDYKRIVILCDEVTETIKALRRWWKSQPGNGRKSCPSADALESILNMGRAARIHIVGTWQRAEAKHVPGQAAGRENFDVKVLVGANKHTFEMLTGGVEFVPPSARPGWAVVVIGFETFEIQRPFADDTPDGNMAVYRWVGAKRGYCGKHARRAGAARGNGHRPQPAPLRFVDESGADTERITFQQAVKERTCPYRSWATASKARQRARNTGTFPHDPERPDDYGEMDLVPRAEFRRWYNDLPLQRRRVAKPPEPLVYFLIGGADDDDMIDAALRGELPGLQAKVGYTDRPLKERVREISGFRITDVFLVIRVPEADDSKPLPDKWWHDEFHAELVHKGDATGELLWVRGRFAAYLREMRSGQPVKGPDGAVVAERWTEDMFAVAA